MKYSVSFLALLFFCFVGTVVVIASASAETVSSLSKDNSDCILDDKKYYYDGLWNSTTLRICPDVTRPEKMCIVGGGSSGVHFAWLLKRRGFHNTVLFEKNDRLGGMIWTKPGDKSDPKTSITRELGAAFLSPDYYEVRAFLKRYNQSDVPLSVVSMMHFHKMVPSLKPFPSDSNIINDDGTNDNYHQYQKDEGNGNSTFSDLFQSKSDLKKKKIMKEQNDIAELPSDYYNDWLSTYTGTSDPEENDSIVAAALSKYYALSDEIFGKYEGRFPPRPKTAEKLQMLSGTAIEFLKRYDIECLYPLMYQFFVLQGMGLLTEMSAYYMLKWCNPVSMEGGGFGNKDYPLAMLKDGYGAMVDSIAKEVELDVRYGWKVKNIRRLQQQTLSKDQKKKKSSHLSSVVLEFENTTEDEECDFLVLSGPITNYIAGSVDHKVKPILTDASSKEKSLFKSKKAMQFLVSLVEFEDVPNEFKALEFWPTNFQNKGKGEVIVRRDVGYAETGQSHQVGGIQSFSYYPYPQCDEKKHWKEQLKWAKQHNKTITKVFDQFYVDTYYFHYDNEDILKGKIWDVDDLQLNDGVCNCTFYIGGCASYETVEDSMQYNLALIDRFFDGDSSVTPIKAMPEASKKTIFKKEKIPGKRIKQRKSINSMNDILETRSDNGESKTQKYIPNTTTRIEVLRMNVSCESVNDFIKADNESWTTTLQNQLGFMGKIVTINPVKDGEWCQLWTMVLWESLETWKSIPSQVLIDTDNQMKQLYGSEVIPNAFPGDNGLNVLYDTFEPDFGGVQQEVLPGYAVELNNFTINCSDLRQFVKADNATWTVFLSKKPGFKRKWLATYFNPDTRKCQMYTVVIWESYTLWKDVCKNSSSFPQSQSTTTTCKDIQEQFVKMFGSAPELTNLPTPEGLSVVTGTVAPQGARLPAIGGNDVVAYFSLKPGENDVRGTPYYRRYIDSANVLPKDLLHYHPQPYEFWFSNSENAEKFEKNPWQFIPAFGGHCSYGIATRNDMTPELLADGRIGFTCIHSNEWVILNGTLYMNSCQMYYDFINDPVESAKKAHQQWKEWFGQSHGFGPINDRCFQNELTWKGGPTRGLIPNQCYLQ